MNRYALVTEWQLRAPIDRAWDALYDVAAWPSWWKYVLARGLASHLGVELLAG
jgi:uncharacterized protein YndB with AHSA1/START domain